MSAESVSKIKYLKIWDILCQETDEEHSISTPDLLSRLEESGIKCDRRTLYRNIEELNECGYEVLIKVGKPNAYYVVDRSFDIPEIHILMDAVQAASFITEKKTKQLVDKIARLSGNKMAEVLKQNSGAKGRSLYQRGLGFFYTEPCRFPTTEHLAPRKEQRFPM